MDNKNNFPCPIVSEKDLKAYDDYLKNDNRSRQMQRGQTYPMQIESPNCKTMQVALPEALTNNAFFPAYLQNHVGKLVKVESLIGGSLINRIGTLLHVGADFIVIKLYQSCSTMMIDLSTVKFITIIHDNDTNKVRMY